MDRNYWWVEGDRFFYYVALRKESVDRNSFLRPSRVGKNPVALRKESVDRNDVLAISAVLELIVALRKESVDRNSSCRPDEPSGEVALRKESVDRNAEAVPAMTKQAVALRKESVDRNSMYTDMPLAMQMSLSARRAWIEIWPS